MSRNGHGLKWGVILILLGLYILLDYFGILDSGDLFGIGIPLLLFWCGVHLIRRSPRGDERCSFGDRTLRESTRRIDHSGTFGDIHITADGPEFAGGSARVVFGDLTVDLTAVKRTVPNAVLELRAVFGDIRVRLPKEIAFKAVVSSAFGSVSGPDGSRIHPGGFRSEDWDGAEQRIEIRISQTFSEARIER